MTTTVLAPAPSGINARVDRIRTRVLVALAEAPADLVLRGCLLPAVHSGETLVADLVIVDGVLAAVRAGYPGRGVEEVDCAGLTALPGLVAPLLAAVPSPSAADVLVAHGVTTVFVAGAVVAADSGVLGPLRVFPPLRADEIHLRGADPSRVLRSGATLVVPDAAALAHVRDYGLDTRHVCLGRADGRTDLALAEVVAAGADLVETVRLAALHAARHHSRDHELGSVTPGRFADIVLTSAAGAAPERVYVGGVLVADHGERS